PAVPHRNRFESRRTRDLKKWEQHQPDCFPVPGVTNQASLPMIREVCVPFVVALMGVMFQVINAKSHRARREIRKIGNDGHHFIPARASENQVVRRIVNDDVVGMIAESADAERDQQTSPPIAETQVAHAERNRSLHCHDRDCDQRSPRIAHHQLANLRMRFDDRSCPPGMRLLRFRLVKRDLHRLSKYCIVAVSSIALFAIFNRSRGRLWCAYAWIVGRLIADMKPAQFPRSRFRWILCLTIGSIWSQAYLGPLSALVPAEPLAKGIQDN